MSEEEPAAGVPWEKRGRAESAPEIDVLAIEAAEREACAAIADRYAHSAEGRAIAAKIRARE